MRERIVEFTWAAPEVELRNEVRTVLAEHLPDGYATLVPGEDPASQTVVGFTRELAARDLMAPHWPREYGGRDASPWQFIVLGEELWRAGEPRGSQYMNVNWIGPAIIAAGTEEQKRLHLNRITSGDVFWCQGFSEPGAGSDLRAVTTSAARDGGDYIVNGQKIWTSYAQFAEYCFLLTRTSPAEPGNPGVTIFLVPTDTPGFRIERIPSVLDVHEYNLMTFEDMRIPGSMRLGEEGQGWEVIRLALTNERIGGPRYARAVAIVDRLEAMIADGTVEETADTGSAVLRARAACEAARMLVYRAIDHRAKQQSDSDDVPIARVAIVRAERLVAELALDLEEGSALRRDSLANGQLKTSMVAGLGSGSVEVQLNLIASRLLGREGR
jgi:alkylation response protein AidB-like acyl-CoA dehydrogenase